MIAFCLRKVDFPDIFGPVSRQIFPSFKIHSFEINAFPSFLRACSTTGWRPPEISKFCDKSTAGLTQDSFLASTEKATARSISDK